MQSVIYLHPTHQHTVARGHPWIFPKAIQKMTGQPKAGEWVTIFNSDQILIASGVYNPHSLYRVRILAHAFEMTDDWSLSTLIHTRLKQAWTLRQALNLPNDATNAFRLFNSEGDGLSGLTIDLFKEIAVVSSSAYWVEANKHIIYDAIKTVFPVGRVVWLPQQKALRQDGWPEALIEKNGSLNANDSQTGIQTEVLEAGIHYQVQFEQAQKTGLFLDQRENHQRIAQLAKGKRVLDLYTYTGGFALHAAAAGAAQVTAVDSSGPAIAQARQNAVLNQLESIQWIKADARSFLDKAGDYDLIILDPPKLVPSKAHLQKARNYYRFLHREIFKSMHSGALLMTCNCSSALSANEFCNLISQQAMMVNKQVRVLGVFGPATCHTLLPGFPEGHYLTAVLAAIL